MASAATISKINASWGLARPLPSLTKQFREELHPYHDSPKIPDIPLFDSYHESIAATHENVLGLFQLPQATGMVGVQIYASHDSIDEMTLLRQDRRKCPNIHQNST